MVHRFYLGIGCWVFFERLVHKAVNLKTGLEINREAEYQARRTLDRLNPDDINLIGEAMFVRLRPALDEIVAAELPKIVERMAGTLLEKQRKDVADELVRILLEKALEPRISIKGQGEPQ